MAKALKAVGTAIVIVGAVVATGGAALIPALAGGGLTGALGTAIGFGSFSVTAGTLINVGMLVSSVGGALSQPKVSTAGNALGWVGDPNGPMHFAAGRIAVGGDLRHKKAYGPNDRMYFSAVTVVSDAGPITAFESFTANDIPVSFDGSGKANSSYFANVMWRRTQLGNQPEASYLASPSGLEGGATLPNWGASYKLSGKAAFILTLSENSKQSAYKGQQPRPQHVIRGLKAYDWRLDSTYPGGSGPHRLDQPTTWTYTANPILWAVKWILGLWEGPDHGGAPQLDTQVGGMGVKVENIDLPAFTEAANIADTHGWTCAAWPSTDDDKAQVLDAFLQAAGAYYIQRGGKESCIHRAAPRVSVATISAADTAGPIELDTGASFTQRKNCGVPTYLSEADGWKMTALGQVSSPQWVEEDGGRERSAPITYNYVDKAKQAAELMCLAIAHTREGIRGRIPLKPYMQGIQPGSAFTITEPEFVLNGLKCLCLETNYDAMTGVHTVTFVSESDGKYEFAFGQAPNPPAPPALEAVDPTYVSPPLPEDWVIVPRPPGTGGQLPGFDLGGIVSNETATAVEFAVWEVPTGVDPNDPPPAGADWQSIGTFAPTVTQVPFTGQPDRYYWVGVTYIRNQNYSERLVIGPWLNGKLIADDVTAIGGQPAEDVLAQLATAEGLAAAAAAGVSELEDVFGDTVSAAQSAADAAQALSDTVFAKADAIAAKNDAVSAAGASASSASQAGGFKTAAETAATASQTSRVASEAARDAAQGSASAASTSASNASSSATAAGTSATAAQTARTGAETARGQAQTFATNASNSADSASGSASTAATQAGLAATSRNQASGFADAAAGSASTASTKATEAGVSASSADASRISASASLVATLPSTFGLMDPWTSAAAPGGPSTDLPTINWPIVVDPDIGRCIEVTGGANIFAKGSLPATPGGRYEVEIAIKTVTPGSAPLIRDARLAADLSYITRGGIDQGAQAAGAVLRTSYVFDVDNRLASHPTMRALRFGLEVSGVTRIALLKITDVKARDAATGAAAAAVTSASSAEASADDAGDFASAASGFATTASTAAGQAQTFSQASSEARDDAVAARNTAQTAADTAGAAAGTAVDASSAATAASASAQLSMLLAAQVGGGSLNGNPNFAGWSGADAVDADTWNRYNSGNLTVSKGPGLNGLPWSSRHVSTGTGNTGSYQDTAGSSPGGDWLVLEADFTLVAGNLTGSGLSLDTMNGSGSQVSRANVNFATDMGLGTGQVGKTYRIRKLVDARHVNASSYRLYRMTRLSTFNPVGAVTIDWHRAAFRVATAEEVEANQAIPALEAQAAILAGATADLEDRVGSAFIRLVAAAGGNPASFEIRSSSGGSAIAFRADKIFWGANTVFDDATDTLQTTVGSNRRILALGAPFGSDGTLLEWWGPSSVAIGSMTTANGYNGRMTSFPYVFDTVNTPRLMASVSPVNVTASGIGSLTTNQTNVSVQNATGTVRYAWQYLSGDVSITPVNAGTAIQAFTGTVSNGQTKTAAWSCTAYDVSGQAASAVVQITIVGTL